MARHRRAESYSCRQARHLTNVLMETRQDLAGTKQQLDEAIGELGRVRAQLQAEVSRSTKLAAELDSEVGRLVGVIRSRDRIEEERVQVIMVEARNEFEVELAEIHERYRLERCRLMVSNAAALRAVEKTIALMDAELCKRDQRIAMLEAAARDDSRVVAMLARANENQMEHERIRQALQAKVVQIAALNDLSVRRQAAMTSRIASLRADLDRRCDQIRSLMNANESLATALDQARNDVRAQQACMRHEKDRLTLVASEITVWQAKQRDRDEGDRFIDTLQTALRERDQRADALSVKVQSLEQQKAEGDQEIAALQERFRAQLQMQASAQRATEQVRLVNQELRREIESRGAECQKTMATELALKESEFNQRLQAELCIQKRNLEGEFGHVQRAFIDDAAQHVSLINDLTLQLDDVQERTTTLTAVVKDLVDENRHLQTECIRFADDLANLQCAKQAVEVEAVRQVQDLSNTIAVLIVQERCLRNDLARQTESSAKMMDTTALELQACRQTCDRLEESVAELQRDRDDLALKLKSLSASEAALVLDRDLLRGQLNDVSRSYEQALARCELGDAGLDALKTELAEAMADNCRLRNEVLAARSDLVANKDKHVHDIEALNDVINTERRAHQEGVDELELTIDSTNARLEEVRRDLHKALETNQTVERQHVETREFLQKAQRDVQEALHAKDIAEQGQASIQNQLQQVQRDLELSRLAHDQAAAVSYFRSSISYRMPLNVSVQEVKEGAQRYMDLEQKYGEVQSLMHSYKNECDRLRGTIDSKDIASSYLKAELDDARRRITTLMATEDENQRLQDECRRLAGELVELQRAKQGLDGDASRHAQALNEKIAALVSQEASLRDEHAKQMEASFKLTSALESDLRESRQACGRLEGSLAETQHDRNDLAVKLERLSTRYLDLEQQHDALQSLVQTYKDECGRLRNAITCNGTASSALQSKLEDAERRVATLTTTEGETQHLRVECHRLARELDDLQRARQVSEEESDHQAQALNETIAALTAQEHSLRDDVAKQMEASAQLVAALESDLREHRQTRGCLETSLAQLQCDRDDLVVRVGNLTASEAALVSDCDLLRGQLDDLRQSYQEALDRCNRSDNRVEAIKREQLETVADNDRLRSELRSAQIELDANAGQHRCETGGLNDIIRLERSAHQEDVRELQSAVDSALEAKQTIEHEHEATKTLLEKAQKDMNDALHAKGMAEESRDSTWNLLEKAQRDLETCASARDQALAEAEMGMQRYKDLEQERNVLHGLLETYKGECAQLRGSVNSNNAVISELRTKVEGAETQAFAMQERLRSLYEQIEALQNELDAAGRTYESRRAVDKQESDRALFQQASP
ncbi:hypothetical protein PBRA_000906 [Plasmodiophora brassicae]|uniref:Uncharacterized protein n=1 Tax=Plasmodiophora brassicae TaxID=37360 RepID=A0A0G4IQZ5_PLABS|nr:hypothetical protein PBRA_000906 [Plasmodiophora brassicae]